MQKTETLNDAVADDSLMWRVKQATADFEEHTQKLAEINVDIDKHRSFSIFLSWKNLRGKVKNLPIRRACVTLPREPGLHPQ